MSKMNTDYLIKLTSDKSRSMSGKGIENILEYADINKLKEKIRVFQNMDVKTMSDKDLEKSIFEVLSIKADGDVMLSTTLSEYSLFRIGRRFYRVRKLKNMDMPNSDLKNT